MPTLHIRIKVGNAEVEIKADGELNRETLAALKSMLQPLTNHIAETQRHSGSTSSNDKIPAEYTSNKASIYTTFKEAITSAFRYGQWFTSIDAREAYYDLYGTLLKSSTTITYLRRMEKEGILVSKKQGKIVKFRLAQVAKPEPQKQRIIIDPF